MKVLLIFGRFLIKIFGHTIKSVFQIFPLVKHILIFFLFLYILREKEEYCRDDGVYVCCVVAEK